MIPLLLLMACGSASDDTGTVDDTADTADCDILLDVSCRADTGWDELACPEGYLCSGPSAWWCYRGYCPDLPECLPPTAAIATPRGAVALGTLEAGDTVFSLDLAGRPIVVPVLRVRHRPAPETHRLVTAVLSDGRVVQGSPAHPTVDGRRLGDLVLGAGLDGATVDVAERTPFGHPATWDLLPGGPTGHYQADGVWLGSTLAGGRLAGR